MHNCEYGLVVVFIVYTETKNTIEWLLYRILDWGYFRKFEKDSLQGCDDMQAGK